MLIVCVAFAAWQVAKQAQKKKNNKNRDSRPKEPDTKDNCQAIRWAHIFWVAPNKSLALISKQEIKKRSLDYALKRTHTQVREVRGSGVRRWGSSWPDSLDPNAFAFAFAFGFATALGFWPSESRTLSDFGGGLGKGKTIKIIANSFRNYI